MLTSVEEDIKETCILITMRRNNNNASFYGICCTSNNLSSRSLICSREIRKHNPAMNNIEKQCSHVLYLGKDEFEEC